MAVENDYNLLVFWINNIAEEAIKLDVGVRRQRQEEARDGLKPNETR